MSTTVINGITYTRPGIDAIASVSGSDNGALIPATIIESVVYIDGSCSVTSIGNAVFQNRAALTSVIIPDSVTSIGQFAFNDNTNLTSITLSNNLISLGQDAVSATGIRTLTIPNSVTLVGFASVYNCANLTSVIVGSSVSQIGEYAFYTNPALRSVVFNNQNNLVTVTGTNIFNVTGAITTVTFYNTVNYDALVEGAKYLYGEISRNNSGVNYGYNSGPPPMVIDGIEYTQSGVSTNVTGFTGSILPASTIQSSVSFNGTVCPVNYIDVNAFQDCTVLTSITIPSSVTGIGDLAFLRCRALSSVNIIGSSINSIGYSAFDGCSVLSSFTIPTLVTNISDSMFKGTAITGITIPASVDRLGYRVFQDCSAMISVTFNGNLIPDFNDDVFKNCRALQSITIPSSVTSIGITAFINCRALPSITIPNLVTSISSNAFNGCSGITSVNIGNNVTSLGLGVFGGCSSLRTFTIPNQITSLSQQLFASCSNLTSVIIPTSVTSIGLLTFAESGLQSVNIPNTVTSIDERAFSVCVSLTSITIGTSVVSIGIQAFADCSGLTFVNIPNSVTSIGSEAFTRCVSLTSITIGTSFTRFNGYAFKECTSLASLTFSDPTKLVPSQGSSNFQDTGRINRVVFNNITSGQLNTGGQTIQSQINSYNSGVTYVFSPTLSNFTIPSKSFGDAPFQITDPSSNSDGSFNYFSSNTDVATILGDIITIVGLGTSIITAIQDSTLNFGSGSIDASFQVLKSPPTLSNFVIDSKTTVDPPFPITPPTSNSSGAFTYTSSNIDVATVSGDIITIVGNTGTSIIRATQAATADFESGYIDASFSVSISNPTITNFAFAQQLNGTLPFQIITPTSNSTGSFSYTSSDIDVATISGDIITIVGIGSSIITATQAATANFNEGTIDASFIVTNPVIINDSSGLLDFMNATDFYGVIENNIIINYDLTSSTPQKILVTENENVTITSA